MVNGMTEYPHSVLLQRNIYVGGGLADNHSDNCTILMYDIENDKWSRLQKYRYRFFAMTSIMSQLTVVGGHDPITNKVTNQLAAFDMTSHNWIYQHYPPMHTPRCRPAVAVYGVWLLVAGGRTSPYGYPLATVELLHTSNKQWLFVSPLPRPCHYMTSAVLDSKWYLVTNSKQVFCASLPDIISQSVSKCNASKSSTLWCRLPDTPLKESAATVVRGSLLAVGGYHDDGSSSAAIHLYQPASEKWIKILDLPVARYQCFCVSLPSGELLVAGGCVNSGRIVRFNTCRVDMASVLD